MCVCFQFQTILQDEEDMAPFISFANDFFFFFFESLVSRGNVVCCVLLGIVLKLSLLLTTAD